MRSFAAIIVTILFYSAASVQAAPDASPLGCVWSKLAAAEQARLSDGFRVEIKDKTFTIFFSAPDAVSAGSAAQACQLNVTPAQAEALGAALSRRAAVEKAKAGIAEKGEDPQSLDVVLANMHEGKRRIIGDALSCPGPHPMVGEWDESMKATVRRSNLHFKNGRAYAWVSLGVYAIVAEEGAMRRFDGTTTDACPAN